jgi:hypothetical protein
VAEIFGTLIKSFLKTIAGIVSFCLAVAEMKEQSVRNQLEMSEQQLEPLILISLEQ